ncbi:MAG TPA: sigma-70 family RNA polymerase sigma factor [Gemmatimonadaceae bacterium]|nr:sigma-70 family RNA polymerase sigma factor [Gemmatimonadaceae bacterium]
MASTVGPGAVAGPAPVELSSTAAAARDLQLAAAIRRGDAQAFETLYRAYHAALWRFAHLAVNSSAVAEELVQDVFLAVWQRRETWDVRESVRGWLYAAVRNRAIKHRRHAQLGERLVVDTTDEVPGLGEAPMDSHDAVEGGDLEDAINRALAAIPERRRVAMTLRWKHALSPAEIARVLQTTPESVRVLLSRARADLATLIGYVRSV